MPRKVFGLSEDGLNALRGLVRDYGRRPRRERLRRRRRWPANVGGRCKAQNEIQQVTVFGGPTGGTFDLYLTLNATQETVTINFDDTAAEVETALEGHSEATAGDFDVTGGPLPDATIEITFQGNFASTEIGVMRANWGSLTGGTGVGVLCSRPLIGR